jgi:hypothetical protein
MHDLSAAAIILRVNLERTMSVTCARSRVLI